ncbi:MAG: class I SAM-dependent methyltransferase [Acidobacteria bacterium]|nr:class I SAM-dependent methyltransferase [Acidobacteriota bacterium]
MAENKANKQHWDDVYHRRSADALSWFQAHAERSLSIVQTLSISKQAKVIDVGGGASTFVDDLLKQGYSNISVLDLSSTALEVSKRRLGDLASQVKWIEGDILQASLPKQAFDLWHDRAVFHFLTRESDRKRYIQSVVECVKPGGYVIVATFAPDGPEFCSGLPVMRYGADELHSEFGSVFELVGHEEEQHHTPGGSVQSFVYCYCKSVSRPGIG